MFFPAVLCTAAGMSMYSVMVFFITFSPLEIQFLCAILNVITAGMTAYTVLHYLPQILGRLEQLEYTVVQLLDCGDDTASTTSNATTATTATTETNATKSSHIPEWKELTECPVESRETEETLEFADLLSANAANATDEKKDN